MFTAGCLIIANVVVPLIGGDIYPFTSAPMFRDAPTECCNYRVFAPDGTELKPEDWQLQRIYDGNPVGYGVGIRPPRVLEMKFGVIHDEAAVRQHVEWQFREFANRKYESIDVVQEVIGPMDGQHLGVVSHHRWRIDRPPTTKP
jgi:hypothetical protein